MPEFYRPIEHTRINQKFGENRACVDIKSGTHTITCDGHNPPEGYKSVYSQMKGHNGIDYFAPRWTKVYASREGTVIEVETEVARGLGIGILHGPYNGKYYKTRYWHLAAMDVDLGDKVYTGSFIGYADNTGYSSGDHLHFELKEVDKHGNTLNNKNGYYGAIDPTPLLSNTFARDINKVRMSLELIASAVDKLADRLRGR